MPEGHNATTCIEVCNIMSFVLYTQILKQSVLKPASPGITLNLVNCQLHICWRSTVIWYDLAIHTYCGRQGKSGTDWHHLCRCHLPGNNDHHRHHHYHHPGVSLLGRPRGSGSLCYRHDSRYSISIAIMIPPLPPPSV